MKTFDVIVRGDRNRLWSRYRTQEQAAVAIAKLKRQGFDAWMAPLADLDSSPRDRPPVQLELQFD
jgi:hypothetical protein